MEDEILETVNENMLKILDTMYILRSSLISSVQKRAEASSRTNGRLRYVSEFQMCLYAIFFAPLCYYNQFFIKNSFFGLFFQVLRHLFPNTQLP